MKRWMRITPQDLDRQGVGYCIKTRNLEQRWKNVGVLVALLFLGLSGISTPANALFIASAGLSCFEDSCSDPNPGDVVSIIVSARGSDAPLAPEFEIVTFELRIDKPEVFTNRILPFTLTAQSNEDAGGQWSDFTGLNLTVNPDLSIPEGDIITVEILAVVGSETTNTLHLEIRAPAPAPAPEPGSLVLLGSSLLGFLWFRYRLCRA